jgi:hypothetical protein
MDFVYICRDGENEELRYSIRSVLLSFPEAKVWVVGGKPKWYSGNHVFLEQNDNKYANAVNNLKAVCNTSDISDNFILMNDDFFIIKKIETIEQFYNGLLSEKIDKFTKITGSSMYIRKLITTNNKLNKLGFTKPLDYELHVPMPMHKAGLLYILNQYPECLWRSMYGNLFNVGGSQMEDVKVYKNKRHAARSAQITKNSIYLSTEDTGLTIMVDNIFKELLTNPSPYEQ